MPTLTEREDALHAFVVAQSGLAADHVIWTHPDAPRPSKPYLSLQLTTLDAPVGGTDEESVADDGSGNAEITIEGPRRSNLSIQCYGVGSVAYLLLVQSALRNPYAKKTLRVDGGWSVLRVGEARNVPMALANSREWEHRHVMEVELLSIASQTHTDDAIEAVVYNGTEYPVSE